MALECTTKIIGGIGVKFELVFVQARNLVKLLYFSQPAVLLHQVYVLDMSGNSLIVN